MTKNQTGGATAIDKQKQKMKLIHHFESSCSIGIGIARNAHRYLLKVTTITTTKWFNKGRQKRDQTCVAFHGESRALRKFFDFIQKRLAK